MNLFRDGGLLCGRDAGRKGFLGWVEDVVNWLACVSLVAMMGMVFVDVAGRYLFGDPLVGTREVVTRYLMVATVWLSISRTQRVGGHVGIDLVMRKVPRRVEVPLSVVVKLAAAVPVAVVAWATYPAMVDSLGERTLGVIELPIAPSWGLVVIGSGLLAIRLVVSACSDVVEMLRAARYGTGNMSSSIESSEAPS